ncbi:hypothetical protein CONPUDRAFT_155606 [Coniophora puteana RWD-64-598 SS2]|uniref:Uncharacterized protein n=1 Tax=Coniophora puteana (strain RWD-64-598) TaxID=741705 RepID=A0A5M3MJ00_CONPW|nr:uncharacterized protein CONPUDRAFT_155606 [Coniophora puteana RWD-64-598 SS2]EIW78900.1 hypothetical protein CONPUDRAFT_155606 [Coniophora puteana RWD-64-598 SS2]
MEHTQQLGCDGPHYKKPSRFLQSAFINNTMTSMVRKMTGLRIQYIQPKGAVVLAMLVVERAFTSYRTGTQCDVQMFLHKRFETATHQYQ